MALFPQKSVEFLVYKKIFQWYVDSFTAISKYGTTTNHFVTMPISKMFRNDVNPKKYVELKKLIDDLKNEKIISHPRLLRDKKQEAYVFRMYPQGKLKFYSYLADELDYLLDEQFSKKKQGELVLAKIRELYKKIDRRSFYFHFCASPNVKEGELLLLNAKVQVQDPPIKSYIESADATHINLIKVMLKLHQEGLIHLNFVDSWRAFGRRRGGMTFKPDKMVELKSTNHHPSHIDYSVFITIHRKLLSLWDVNVSDKENKKESHFDETQGKIIYGEKICEVENDSSHYLLCRIMLNKPTGIYFSWDIVFDEMFGIDQEDDRTDKEKRDALYFSQFQVNKKTEEIFGKQVFKWKSKQIQRLF